MAKRGRKKGDRKPESAVVLVSVKLSAEDVRFLDLLVERQARELSAAAGGAKVKATRGTLLRAWLRREAAAVVEEVSHG